MTEMDPRAAERAEEWAEGDDEDEDAPEEDDLSLEAPEADVIEQHIDVDLDDDDYR
ncbi:MAG TPA: hypothetical protein VGL93_14765 [Streptosporangiaceae bacterium]|jgi:hypothetical protein